MEDGSVNEKCSERDQVNLLRASHSDWMPFFYLVLIRCISLGHTCVQSPLPHPISYYQRGKFTYSRTY